MGILVISLSLLNILPGWLAQIYEIIISSLNHFVGFIAGHEGFIFKNIQFTVVMVLLSYLIIILFFSWAKLAKPKYLIVTLMLVLFFQGYLFSEKYKRQKTDEMIVFNRMGQSILALRKGEKVDVYHSEKDSLSTSNSLIRSYLAGTGTEMGNVVFPLRNFYSLYDEDLLVIDSLGIYTISGAHSDKVLITQNPQINLERLILEHRPSLIIVDASNYKNRVFKWKQTCKKYNIAFHYTVTDGAYIKRF